MRRKNLLILSLCAAGCAATPQPSQAIDTAKSVLVGVDIAAETAAPEVVAARDIMIERCRAKDLPTEDDRRACLGPLAEPVAPVAAKASEAYDKVLEGLDELGDALREIEAMRGASKAVVP